MANDGAMNTQDLKVTPKEVANAGWSVVLPGEVYFALYTLIHDMIPGQADVQGKVFLMEMEQELLKAKPVKPRVKDALIVPG